MLLSLENSPKIIRSDRRTIALEIQSDGCVIIRAPKHIHHSYIQKLLNEKQDWILEKQKIIAERQTKVLSKQYVQDEDFYYLGKKYKLDIVDNYSKTIEFNNGFKVFAQDKESVKILILSWYKKQAKKIIPSSVFQIAESNNLTFNNVKITSAEKRWGSCTSKKTLNFSWRIIMLPAEIIEYIIIHELAHLKELNHSRSFWREVEYMMSDYKQKNRWLKNNSYKFKL